MRRRSLRALVATSALAVASFASEARASNVTEFPDSGSEQMGRGGAWVARATDPLATFFNPAGLAWQPTKLTLQANIIFHHTCFSRIKSNLDTSSDPLEQADGNFPRVCNDIAPFPNPQLAFTYRLTDRIGLGLAVMGPNAAGKSNWPEFIDTPSGPQASPNRFLLSKSNGLVVFPQVGIGVEVLENLRLGASFQWGVAHLAFAKASIALNGDNNTPDNDVRAHIEVKDYFVPGFTLGGLYSATDEIDVGAWYKWSDSIRARGDVGTAANYFSQTNARGDSSSVRYGDTIFDDCGTGRTSDQQTKPCGSGDNATLKVAIPMEAKIGARYHKPRTLAGAPAPGADPNAAPPPRNKRLRDPLKDDVFDVEMNLTWANNSAIDSLQIRFPGNAEGDGVLPVAGIPGGTLPQNADVPKNYKDVFGVRVGGDYNVLPDQLAFRAGAFLETRAQDDKYQNIDFAPGARFGLSAGGTFRIRTGSSDGAGAIDLLFGYGHIFVASQANNAFEASGVAALAGTQCNPAANSQPGPNCKNSTDPNAPGNQKYRTNWPVNLGTITNAVNIINVGAAYKF